MPLTYEFGDLWSFYDRGWFIVITTNLGWKNDGSNVMGRGIAKEASDRFPRLAERYGEKCRKHLGKPFLSVFKDLRLVMLPTKLLNYSQPYLSWKSNSDPELIDRSLKLLSHWINKQVPPFRLAMSYPGCGNGGLKKKDVIPLLDSNLGNLHSCYSVYVVDRP